MAMGKRINLGQVLSVAVLAGAAMSAHAASSKAASNSQGSAHASATGQANASSSSALNSGSTTATTSSSSSSNNGNSASASASNGSSSGSSSSDGGSASATSSSTTSTGTLVTSSGTASGAAAASATPGGVTYGVDAFNNLAAANGFYGLVSGNDNAGINGLDLSWGGGWTLAAKDNTDSSDDVANRVMDIAFSVDAGAKASAGHWQLTGTGMSTGSVLLDVVAVLKSSTEYGLYYFHNVAFDGAVGGDWLSPSFNDHGVRRDLSHLSVYVRPGTEEALTAQPQGGPTNTASGGLSAPNAVPEPGTLALLSTALLAMAAIRRKRSRRA
jgi:hypothetical protein